MKPANPNLSERESLNTEFPSMARDKANEIRGTNVVDVSRLFRPWVPWRYFVSSMLAVFPQAVLNPFLPVDIHNFPCQIQRTWPPKQSGYFAIVLLLFSNLGQRKTFGSYLSTY
jgi:hypothetical protein